MQGTMLEISKSDLTACKVLLGHPDDCVLQVAAYTLQQSVEKALKYCYAQSGLRTPKTHDISMLLQGLGDIVNRFPPQLLDKLETKADTLTKWEEKTRYPNDYMATRNMIIASLDMAQELLIFVEGTFVPSATPRSQKSRKLNLGG